MPYYVVIREGGAAWDASRPMEQQAGWAEHAQFMDALAEEGVIRLGGPLGDGPHRALLIFDAESREAVDALLDADRWTTMHVLRTVEIAPWQIRLGALPAR